MRIEDDLELAAPTESVWALTIDIERWPQLMSTVTSVERLDPGPLRAGSTARLKQPGQRATVWTVSEVDPGRRFAWWARTQGMRVVATHTLTPTGTGTRNHLAIDLDGPAAPVLGRVLRRRIARVLAAENAAFKAAAEASSDRGLRSPA
jgi:uncharacterized membrane protein